MDCTDIDFDKSDKVNLLVKRNLERKLDVQKRKDDKDSASAENEKVDFFETTFSKNVTEVESALDKVDDVAPSDRPEYFNNVSKQILALQKFVAASNIFLKSYHIKKCQNRIQSLTLKARELEKKLLPKKKFEFKSKKKMSTSDILTNNPGCDKIDCALGTEKNEPDICDYTNKSGALIVMNQIDVYKKDITVQKLQSCCVKICGSPSTLHMSHIRKCHIFSGPVSTSIFAEDCENSVLVIACQQLRLHNSKNITIYLHVTSRAIMEDCSNISIAPYNWRYDGIENDFKESGLEITHNNWKCIDDFNWLNIHKPSPNWRVHSEYEHKPDWNEVISQFK